MSKMEFPYSWVYTSLNCSHISNQTFFQNGYVYSGHVDYENLLKDFLYLNGRAQERHPKLMDKFYKNVRSGPKWTHSLSCTCCVLVGGAVQTRTAGQTAEDHGRHQLVHVDLCWTPLTAGGEESWLNLVQTLQTLKQDSEMKSQSRTFWERRCRKRRICRRTEALKPPSAWGQPDPPHLELHFLPRTENTPERKQQSSLWLPVCEGNLPQTIKG